MSTSLSLPLRAARSVQPVRHYMMPLNEISLQCLVLMRNGPTVYSLTHYTKTFHVMQSHVHLRTAACNFFVLYLLVIIRTLLSHIAPLPALWLQTLPYQITLMKCPLPNTAVHYISMQDSHCIFRSGHVMFIRPECRVQSAADFSSQSWLASIRV